MDKNYSEHPILDEIIADKKKSHRTTLIFGTATVLLFSIMMFIVLKENSFLQILLGLIIPIVFISSFITSCFGIDKKVIAMKDKFGLNTAEELENLLEKCTKLSTSLYMSDTDIINFDTNYVFRIRSVTKAETSEFDSDEGKPYAVKLSTRGSGTQRLGFDKKDERDKAYKIISAAVDFADSNRNTPYRP